MNINHNQSEVLELGISIINDVNQVATIEIDKQEEDILSGSGKCRSCGCKGFSWGYGDDCKSCGHPYSHHK